MFIYLRAGTKICLNLVIMSIHNANRPAFIALRTYGQPMANPDNPGWWSKPAAFQKYSSLVALAIAKPTVSKHWRVLNRVLTVFVHIYIINYINISYYFVIPHCTDHW